MPLIHVEMLEGRPPERKRELIEELTKTVERVLGTRRESIRVVILEIPKAHWGIGGGQRGGAGALMGLLRSSFQLTLEAARIVLDGAISEAVRQGVAVNVAVVDQGGNLLAFARMDGAPLLSSTIAQNKAYTAAAFGMGTHEWYPMIAKEPALLHGIVHTDRLVIFAGGLPIEVEARLLGGVGVSGGSAEQDLACARAGIEAFRKALGSEPHA